MIFQAYQTLEEVNGTAINGILQTAAQAVPIFPGLIFLAIFIVLAYASYYTTQRRLGRGDMPASFAVGGFVAVVVGLVMTLVPNFINRTTIVTAIVLEIFFVAWLFFSGKRD